MKRKVLGLNSARLYGLNPDPARYREVPDDYSRRIAGDAQLRRTMEYDDRLPNDPPMKTSSPYGVAAADRNDRMQTLRAGYREEAGTRFGVPRSNRREGWIRVR